MNSVRPQPEASAVTLAVLADELGVHVSTVSRALSEHPVGVGAGTIERVRDYALERGYRHNAAARSLRTGRSKMIGVMVPRLTDIVQATIYDGIDQTANAAGYSTVVVNTRNQPAIQQSRLDLMLSRHVDGIIVCDSRSDANLIPRLRRSGIPYVLVVRRLPRQISVTTDDLKGGRIAAEHLLSLGHHRVGVASGDPHASTGLERTKGFRDAYAAAGHPVPDELVAGSGFEVKDGHDAGAALLDRPRPPTAIFAASDFAAVGVLAAMRDRGLTAPGDVAVVGFNDLDVSAQLQTPLTSVRSDLFKMGSIGVDVLLNMLKGNRVRSHLLEPVLRVRASTIGWEPRVGEPACLKQRPSQPAGAGMAR